MNRSLILALLVGCCVSLAGCGSTTRVVQNNETCGKQMTDLQNALASGAMTQSEYERARREAIKRCDKSS
ncbi:hypothetical protein [Dyella sp. Tek66A03]|uniref:hypothetical protein n=1 Tax=Dyella sp. Tek66A03 TaxID=3458298 RepID=UPI00403E40E2